MAADGDDDKREEEETSTGSKIAFQDPKGMVLERVLYMSWILFLSPLDFSSADTDVPVCSLKPIMIALDEYDCQLQVG